MVDVPKYFISHSWTDNRFALQLKESLEDEAWIDLFNLDAGDIVIDEIASGIQGSTDFILLWSAHSARSRWVNFELNLAFVRHIEDQAIALRVIVLDETPVPLKLRPYLQIRSPSSVDEAVDALRRRPPNRPRRRSFFNCAATIGSIEESLLSNETCALWLWGVHGVGKRTVVQEAMRRIIGTTDNFRTISVKRGTREVELALLLAASSGEDGPSDGASSDEVVQHCQLKLREFQERGGVWIFLDAHHWLQDDASPTPLLEMILRAIDSTEVSGRLVIFTGTRRLANNSTHVSTRVTRLTGLDPSFGAGLLEDRGSTASIDVRRTLSQQLDGHPLALEMVATDNQAALLALDEHRIRVAKELIGSTYLPTEAQSVLEVLAAVDGPLPASEIAEHLRMDPDSFDAAVSVCESSGFLESSSSGFLRVPELVREYFLKALRRKEGTDRDISDLASRAQQFHERLDIRSSVQVASLISTFRLLSLSMRLNEAFLLRSDLAGSLYEAAIELYDERRHAEALAYLDQVILPGDRGPDRYRARSLAYLGRFDEARGVVQELLQGDGGSQDSLRVAGRVEYIARNWTKALEYFERALAAGRRFSALYVDVGQTQIRAGRWDDAERTLERAVSETNPSPFALNLFGQVLEHKGDLERAAALFDEAARQTPFDPRFQHRLGRVAEQRGDYSRAEEYYMRALEIDAEFEESFLSLTSMLVDLGRLDDARALLEQAPSRPRKPSVVHNVKAKLEAASDDLVSARRSIEKALDIDRGVHNLSLFAHIIRASAKQGLISEGEAAEALRRTAEELALAGEAAAAEEIDALQPGADD